MNFGVPKLTVGDFKVKTLRRRLIESFDLCATVWITYTKRTYGSPTYGSYWCSHSMGKATWMAEPHRDPWIYPGIQDCLLKLNLKVFLNQWCGTIAAWWQQILRIVFI